MISYLVELIIVPYFMIGTGSRLARGYLKKKINFILEKMYILIFKTNKPK